MSLLWAVLQSSSDADTSPGATLCSGGSCCSSVRGFPAWLCRAAADHTLGCGSALPPDVMLFSFHGRLPLLLCFFILCNISAFSLYLLRCFYFCACCCYQWHSNARNRFKISKKALSGLNLWCNLWLHFKELSKDLNLSQRWCLLAEARLQDTLVHSP